ncbi:MAG TPA: M28 family metallopeptidase [Sphingomicrobium sp.]|nr:M28 family metallopeptidase [Sphingomicrobium sp.]
MRAAVALALIAPSLTAPVVAANAAQVGVTPLPVATTPAAKRIRADVDFLAHDLLEGREAGQRGYELAARFVTARMIGLGLAPGTGGGFEQQIRFLSRALRRDGKSFVEFDGRRLVHGEDVLVSATSEPATTAEAVFVGYGLEDRRFKLDDYAGLDVQGKIVVMLAGFPTGLPSDVAAHLNNSKAKIAKAHGAIGLVIVDTPTRERVNPWSNRVARAYDRSLAWLETDGMPHDSAPGIKARASMNAAAAARLFAYAPRDWATIKAEIADLGARPRGFVIGRPLTIAASAGAVPVTSPNIIGLIPGRDRRLSREVVVLSAHLDHLGLSNSGSDRVFNGALDNATGIAVLLEVARALKTGQPPRRTIAIVALTAEEKGLLGSDYLAHSPPFGTRRMVANVNIDMPVLLGRFTGVLAFGAEHSSLGDSVARAARSERLAMVPDPTPEQAYFVRSDQYSFVQAGIPAIKLNPQLDAAGAAREAAFRTRHYHKESDSMALPIWWDEVERFARLNLAIARDIADRPATPAWKPESYFRP